MAAQADSTAGFYEEVTHAETPDVFGRGARYAVGGAGDLRVQAGGSGDRAVTVAPGTAWGDAVLAYWTSGGAVLNAAANGGATRRWDTAVIRRDWSTQTATLMILQGGSAETLAPGVVLRNPSAGVGAGYTVADQPIALVPVDPGSAVINTADIRDLRLWSGEGGGLVANHVKARDYITSVGSTVRIGSTLHTRLLDLSGNPYWDEIDLSRAGGARFDASGILTAGTVPWARMAPPVGWTGNGGTAAGGWYGASETALNNFRIVRDKDLELYLRLRLNSGTLAMDGNGVFPNTPTIFTLDPAWRPLYMYPFAFTYRTTGGGVRGGVGRVSPEGYVQVVSGTPGAPIQSFAAEGSPGAGIKGYSFMAQLRHTIA